MYALAGNANPWPLCRYKIASGTPASIATEMPPLRAEIPEKRAASQPDCDTAQRIMSVAC